MQRILIIGCSGSGKSTLAKKISHLLDIRVYHLDHIIWRPNWLQQDPQIISNTIAMICKEPAWILDGTYSKTLHERIVHADSIVFLDIPRWRCFIRIIRRYISYRWRNQELIPGCAPALSYSFLHYVFSFNKRFKPCILKLFSTSLMQNKKIFILRSNNDIAHFYDHLHIIRKQS